MPDTLKLGGLVAWVSLAHWPACIVPALLMGPWRRLPAQQHGVPRLHLETSPELGYQELRGMFMLASSDWRRQQSVCRVWGSEALFGLCPDVVAESGAPLAVPDDPRLVCPNRCLLLTSSKPCA